MRETKAIKKAKKKSLDYAISDGVAWSVMSGTGDEYLSPFAIHLGASNLEIGMLGSLPGLVASLAQLKTPGLVEKTGSRKSVIKQGVFLHALMWLPIILLPFIFKNLVGLALIIFVSLRAMFGGIAGPAWSSLMGDLVSEKERGRYFGFRNKLVLVIFLLATLLAGLFLNIFPKEAVLYGFIVLFLVAMLFRFISLHYLNKMYEPRMVIDKKRDFSFFAFIKKARYTNFGRFSIYLAALLLATSIAGPFFTVFMLRDLKFSYLQYAIIHISPPLVSFLIYKKVGKLIDSFGAVRLMKMSGLFIPFVPIFWLFSTNFFYLIIVELFSGFVWTIFNLCTFTFVYDAVRTPQVRTFCISYNNVLSGVAVFIGTGIGGLLATYALKNPWLFVSTLQMVFLISGLARFFVTLILLPKIKEERIVKKGPLFDLNPILDLSHHRLFAITKLPNWMLHQVSDVKISLRYLKDDVVDVSRDVSGTLFREPKKK